MTKKDLEIVRDIAYLRRGMALKMKEIEEIQIVPTVLLPESDKMMLKAITTELKAQQIELKALQIKLKRDPQKTKVKSKGSKI